MFFLRLVYEFTMFRVLPNYLPTTSHVLSKRFVIEYAKWMDGREERNQFGVQNRELEEEKQDARGERGLGVS